MLPALALGALNIVLYAWGGWWPNGVVGVALVLYAVVLDRWIR